jgi:hypothetical protein
MRSALLRLGALFVALVLLLGAMYVVAQNRGGKSGVILYDQYNNANWWGSFSNSRDGQAADDFVIPIGQTWVITQVEVAGIYVSSVERARSVNIEFYQSAGSLPGAEISAQDNITYTVFPPDSAEAQAVATPATPVGLVDSTHASFAIEVNPVTLSSGAYWLSVQANIRSGPEWGFWLWAERLTTANNAEAFRQNGECRAWSRLADCYFKYIPNMNSDTTEFDAVFRLRGTILSQTPPPTDTPTNHPPTDTPTNTPTPSVQAGTATPPLPPVTSTSTSLPTSTPEASRTNAPTATLTALPTILPPNTATVTPTRASTSTPSATEPASTAPVTATSTETNIPSLTAKSLPTSTPTIETVVTPTVQHKGGFIPPPTQIEVTATETATQTRSPK